MVLLMLVVHFLVLNHSAQYSWSVNSSKQQVSTKWKNIFRTYSSRSEVSKCHTNQYSNFYQHSPQELTHLYCASTLFTSLPRLENNGVYFPHPFLPPLLLCLFERLLFWHSSLDVHNVMPWERRVQKLNVINIQSSFLVYSTFIRCAALYAVSFK